MGKNDPTQTELWKASLIRRFGRGAFLSREFLEKDWLLYMQKKSKKQSKIKDITQSKETIGAVSAALAGSVGSANETLGDIQTTLTDCKRCKLCSTRTNIVFGEGNPQARLMFVGEGPGEQEDLSGRPFVGRAGQLLTKIIEAMGLKREDVYIANVVKCRPPNNRRPESDEVASCEGFLSRQIQVIKPEVIVALGATALECLVKTDVKITKSRGMFMDYMGTKLLPTYHPAYLLRNPPAKKDVWEDMKKVAAELGIEIPQKS